MVNDLDTVSGLTGDAEGGVVFDVHTSTGVQSWRYSIESGAVIARTGKLAAVLAAPITEAVDRQWVLAWLLDRGVDHLGYEPAGLDVALDVCQTCGDPLAWCPEWVSRWPRLSDHRDNR